MVVACTRDCYDTCVFDSSYKPLAMFPINSFTCSRGLMDLKRNEINRVKHAFFEGKEVNISDAVREIVRKIKEIKKEKVLHIDYDGNQGLLTWYYPARLWNLLKTSSTDYSICSLEGNRAIRAHYGKNIGALPRDFVNFNSVVFWGSEASISFIHGWRILREKYKVTIDVRLSETAKKSDKYYIVKPGSDAFLAIGIMKVLIEKNPPSIVNLEEVRERVEKYDFNIIIRATGLSLNDIEELGKIYYEHKPLTVIGFALGRTINGGHSVGLISLLPSLVGLRRGFFYQNSDWGIDFNYLRGLHVSGPSRVIGMGEVGEAIESGEVEFIFVWNANPVVTLPGGDRIEKYVREGKVFLVVHDPFWSETAKIANVLLPAKTFLEKEDIVYSYWHNYLVYNEPIRNGPGVTEVELMRLLSKEYGISHPLIDESPWEAVNYAIKATGINIEQLKREKIVEIIPEVKEEVSLEPFPEPWELKIPSSDSKYLVFSSHPNYTNSQFKEIYGKRDAVVYNSDYEGEGELITKYGKAKVLFKKKEGLPNNVLFIFKNSLVGLDGKTVNSIIPPIKGKFGGPLLNTEVKVKYESPCT
jgi:anaerobic selenocysteine-containing dehydrogenase